MIVLDTSVLSLALRRRPSSRPEPNEARELRRLIAEDEALAVPGIVAQELLSGIASMSDFLRVRSRLLGFGILLATTVHHFLAAEIFNLCRRRGLAVSSVDCLIAAQTVDAGAALFTTDEDFRRIAPHCRLRLHVIA